MTLNTLQTKFGARCRAWNVAQFNQEAPPSIRLRLDDELIVPAIITSDFAIKDKKEVLRYVILIFNIKNSSISFLIVVFFFHFSWFNHKLEVRCKDLSLALSMSTVTGLTDLSEDEIIAKPLPMEIFLENLKLTLIEDRPPINITSPGSVPINLQIGNMHITRNEMGIFEIQPTNYNAIGDGTDSDALHPMAIEKNKRERERELISLQLVMQQLKLDNDKLKKQLNSVEQTSEVNT